MSLNRYAKARDLSEPDIIKALEGVGAEVWPLDYPVDLLVRFRQQWHLLECKTIHVGRRKELKDKRQTAQQTFIATTGTPIVRTPIEALRAIGATQETP
jgi:hypothetical protein